MADASRNTTCVSFGRHGKRTLSRAAWYEVYTMAFTAAFKEAARIARATVEVDDRNFTLCDGADMVNEYWDREEGTVEVTIRRADGREGTGFAYLEPPRPH